MTVPNLRCHVKQFVPPKRLRLEKKSRDNKVPIPIPVLVILHLGMKFQRWYEARIPIQKGKTKKISCEERGT